MKHILAVFTALLLAPGLTLHAAEESKAITNRPLVGVIRWDGYNGSPAVTQERNSHLLSATDSQS